MRGRAARAVAARAAPPSLSRHKGLTREKSLLTCSTSSAKPAAPWPPDLAMVAAAAALRLTRQASAASRRNPNAPKPKPIPVLICTCSAAACAATCAAVCAAKARAAALVTEEEAVLEAVALAEAEGRELPDAVLEARGEKEAEALGERVVAREGRGDRDALAQALLLLDAVAVELLRGVRDCVRVARRDGCGEPLADPPGGECEKTLLPEAHTVALIVSVTDTRVGCGETEGAALAVCSRAERVALLQPEPVPPLALPEAPEVLEGALLRLREGLADWEAEREAEMEAEGEGVRLREECRVAETVAHCVSERVLVHVAARVGEGATVEEGVPDAKTLGEEEREGRLCVAPGELVRVLSGVGLVELLLLPFAEAVAHSEAERLGLPDAVGVPAPEPVGMAEALAVTLCTALGVRGALGVACGLVPTRAVAGAVTDTVAVGVDVEMGVALEPPCPAVGEALLLV